MTRGEIFEWIFSERALQVLFFAISKYLGDVQVYRTQIVVKVANSDRVTSVINSYNPVLTSINTSPSLSAEQAQTIAKNHIGLWVMHFLKGGI